MLNCNYHANMHNWEKRKAPIYACQRDAANASQTHENVFFVKAAPPRPPSTVRAFAYSVMPINL